MQPCAGDVFTKVLGRRIFDLRRAARQCRLLPLARCDLSEIALKAKFRYTPGFDEVDLAEAVVLTLGSDVGLW